MIAGIVTIAAIAELVVSIRSLAIATVAEIDFCPSDRDRCDRWQSLGPLAIAGKMKIWFPHDHYDPLTVY